MSYQNGSSSSSHKGEYRMRVVLIETALYLIGAIPTLSFSLDILAFLLTCLRLHPRTSLFRELGLFLLVFHFAYYHLTKSSISGSFALMISSMRKTITAVSVADSIAWRTTFSGSITPSWTISTTSPVYTLSPLFI